MRTQRIEEKKIEEKKIEENKAEEKKTEQIRKTGIVRLLPFAGVGLVFRRQMRARSWRKDTLWAGLLLLALLAASGVLQKTWTQTNLYNGSAPAFLMRWLTMGAVGACGVFLPCAAVVGAEAVPSSEEAQSTQEMLLTRLSAGAICLGRLGAGLWPLFLALLLSCGFWSVAQRTFPFMEGALHGLLPIWEAHLVVACALYMVGSIAFVSALRRHPGRAWGRGTGVGLLIAAGCVTALFLLDKQIQRMQEPQRLIETTLLINPVSAVAAALKLDVLRTDWLYNHTSAPEYLFAYPSPLASAGGFVFVGLIALGLSAWRLRRAYQ